MAIRVKTLLPVAQTHIDHSPMFPNLYRSFTGIGIRWNEVPNTSFTLGVLGNSPRYSSFDKKYNYISVINGRSDSKTVFICHSKKTLSNLRLR